MPEDRKLPNFNRSPMLWLVVAFAAGILSANFRNIDISISISICVLLSLFAFLLRSSEYATFLIMAAFVAAGATSIAIEKQNVGPDRIKALIESGTVASGSPVEVEGVIREAPEPSIDGEIVRLEAETVNVQAS